MLAVKQNCERTILIATIFKSINKFLEINKRVKRLNNVFLNETAKSKQSAWHMKVFLSF